MQTVWKFLYKNLWMLGSYLDLSHFLWVLLEIASYPSFSLYFLRFALYLLSALILLQEAFQGTMALTPLDALARSSVYAEMRNMAYDRSEYEGCNEDSYEEWNVPYNSTGQDCSLVMLQAALCTKDIANEATYFVATQAVIASEVVYTSAREGLSVLGNKTQEAAMFIGENAVPAAELARDAAYSVGKGAAKAAVFIGENAVPAAELARDAAYSMGKGAAKAAVFIGENAVPAAELARDAAYSVGNGAAKAAVFIGENAVPAAELARDAAYSVGKGAAEAAFYIGENAGPAAGIALDAAYSVGKGAVDAASYIGESEAAKIAKEAWNRYWS